jgi:hypothetical protein
LLPDELRPPINRTTADDDGSEHDESTRCAMALPSVDIILIIIGVAINVNHGEFHRNEKEHSYNTPEVTNACTVGYYQCQDTSVYSLLIVALIV